PWVMTRAMAAFGPGRSGNDHLARCLYRHTRVRVRGMKRGRYSMGFARLAKIALIAAVASVKSAGCGTNPETGNRTSSKTAIGGVGGALGGYLLGDLLGGRHDRTEKIVGAGIGAIAGAGVGAYMDSQEKKMRERTAGTGIDVVREGDELLL